jgi:hypothetical protein
MGRIASSLAALGNGTQDGEIAFISVSQGGETHRERLIWDSVAQKWVGPKRLAITSSDGNWVDAMGDVASTDWVYLGNSVGLLGTWFLRAGAIPFAGALIAAGLKLQDRMNARIHDGVAFWVSPWYYQYDDADPLVFDNDQSAQAAKTWNGHADLGFEPASANIGHGVVLKSDGTGGFKMYGVGQYDDGIAAGPYPGLAARNGGWDYVKFFQASQPAGSALGGVPTSTPAVPTKKFLYPTLYCKGGIAAGGAAAISYETRWTS